jgi:AAA domain
MSQPKHTPQEMAENIVGQLDSIESVLDYLATVDTTEITRATGRINRRLAAMTGIEQARLWDATDLEAAKQPEFLAKERIVRAAVNLLIGDEGIGKSLFWVWLVAAITTGKPLHEFGVPERVPADVVVVVTEDHWSSVVRPRLEVVKADLSRIKVLCVEKDGSGTPVFPNDLPFIYEADPKPAAVIVDAWLDTVPTNLNVQNTQQARQALHPWRELATVTGAAVLLVCHTNRSTSPNARDRYGATAALRQKARLTLFAQQDDDGALLIGPEKSNTSGTIPASKFSIEAVPFFPATADHDGTVPRLSYQGESEKTAREHITDTAEGQDAEPGGNPAQMFIHDHLNGQANKEAPAADVLKEGKAAGFGEQELKDARRRHRKPRIASRKSSFGAGWVWAIVHDEDGDAIQGGAQQDQGGEDGSDSGMPPASPPSPPSPPSDTPPGGLTEHTPGLTPRVQQIAARNNGRFAADPPCYHCDKPVTGKQTDTQGRYAHINCQREEEEAK